MESNLGKEKISKLLFRFSLPCIISMLVNSLYNIVDQIFIGNSIGIIGNAATNIVFPFTVVALAISLLLGDGCAALFSLSLGKKEDKTANKCVGNNIIISIILAFIITTIGVIFRNKLLNLFGATEDSFNLAKEYMTIILIGLPFYIIGTALSGIIRTDGSPKYAMFCTLIGAIINIILDPIAIFVFNMGIKGAGLATIIGQIVSCLMIVLYFRKTKILKLSKESFKLDKQIIKRICSLGISSFITQISLVIIMTVLNNLIRIYGSMSEYGPDIPMSAMGIVMKVFGIIISFIIGVSVGGQPIVGYNYGAGNYKRVKETYKYIIITNIIVGLIGTFIFEVFPQAIINIFGNESELYNEFAKLCFRVYLSGMIFCAITKATSIFLQSIGKTTKSMILSISRDVLIIVPAMCFLAYKFGVKGMLLAAPCADLISSIIAIILITIEFKKLGIHNIKEEYEELNDTQIKETKEHIVITIAREYGSGGRYIGKLLAESLNINYYDKELIKLVAKNGDFSEEYVKENEQSKKGGYNDDRLFIEESAVIRDLAEKESCVIIGRCSDYILRDNKEVLKVFIYSTEEDKIKRAIKYYNIKEKEAEREIKRINKERERHYKFYTGREWTNLENYDIAINVSDLGIQRTVELLCKMVKSKIEIYN